MLESIYIENFRCFKKTKFNNFSQINLVSGLNNSGKSALLEAILFALNFEKNLVKKLNELRDISENNPLLNERSWDYFFHNLNSKDPIKFECKFKNDSPLFFKIIKERIENLNELAVFEELENNEKLINAKKEFNRFFSKNTHTYSLNFYASTTEALSKDTNELISSYVYTDKGELERKREIPIPVSGIAYFSSKRDSNNEQIISFLNEALANGKYLDILSRLKNIDNTIEDIRIVDNKIMLARDNMIFLPIGLFGDAIYTVLDIVLTLLVLPENSLIIIDEIENGIHHTKHKIIIETLFSLINNRSFQVFATSHSAEFINTYNNFISNLSTPNDKEKFSYFELIKTKHNTIIGNKIDDDTLNYKIDNNKSFRGEL